MQEKASLLINDVPSFKQKLLLWANQFEVCICLDNHSNKNPYHLKEFVVAVDALKQIKLYNEAHQFDALQVFKEESKSTIFGYLSYDLKNELENLKSENEDRLNLPNLFFFEPRYTFEIIENKCIVNRSTLEALWLLDQINAIDLNVDYTQAKIDWQSKIDKATYIQHVKKIQEDIKEGTVYELNYCRESYAQNVYFHPVANFLKINNKAKAPFTVFFKMGKQFALSFSPERFMQINDSKLLSQPIKGTIKRGGSHSENDLLKKQLLNDEKERAENVMIVDLVRNDFAKSAETGSVKVDELFGIYEFENIIQMISTVTATKRKEINSLDALKNAFPMGSMTGAPKIKAMELIENYESSKRGLYSGCIGYFDDNDNFDFNVVIRTLIYDEDKQYLSFHVGGAITYDSIPQNEWYETETKAQSILNFLD